MPSSRRWRITSAQMKRVLDVLPLTSQLLDAPWTSSPILVPA
jgi:hypothetical protein